MSNRKRLTLEEIQARLDALVERRTKTGLTSSEEAEYRELIALEAEALANRGGFGQP